MYYICVLYSRKLQKRYVGSTSNLIKRILEHNSGKSKFTKSGMPWELILYEEYQTNCEARNRELYLKTGVGRKYLDQKLDISQKSSAP